MGILQVAHLTSPEPGLAKIALSLGYRYLRDLSLNLSGKKINPMMISAIYDKKSFTGILFSHTNSMGPSEMQEENSNIVFLIAS